MGSISSKPILSVPPATLNQEVSGLRNKDESAWLLGKHLTIARSIRLPMNQKSQVLRNVLARKSQLERAKTVNTHGANTSISRLLVSKDRFGDIVKNKTTRAKTKITGSMKKAFSFSKTDVQKDGILTSLRRKLQQDNQPEEMYLSEIEVESEPVAEADHSEQTIPYAPEPEPISVATETPAETPTPTQKRQSIQETPTECLTCEKLIHCNIRSKLSAETDDATQDIAPCRLLGITT